MRWRLVLAVVAACLLAACGSSHRTPTNVAARFPRTAAGAQAAWLFGAAAHLPIPDATVRAHFDQAFLAQVTPSQLNSGLAGTGQLRLVSITTSQPNSLVFVVSVNGAQQIRVNLSVDAHGLIADLLLQPVESPTSSASDVPALAPGWVAQPITFAAGGITIYGTYTHPRTAAPGRIAGAVLIAGSGPADRNDNEPGFQVYTLQAVADWLSADGVATLRYDKLGSGQTGEGPYAAHPDRVGIRPFEQEAAAALSFLARQPSIDRSRLAVVGHSEGGLYALLLATGLAGKAPAVHALVLLEPLSIRILDVINEQVTAQVAAERQAGKIDAAQARSIEQALAGAIASLRATGTVPRTLPDGLATALNPTTQLYLFQEDRYNPAVVAAKLEPQLPTLLTCSNADYQVSCADVDHLAAGLAHARAKLNFVHLDGVDHVLKEDTSRTSASYTKPLPFSTQLRSALRAFIATNL